METYTQKDHAHVVRDVDDTPLTMWEVFDEDGNIGFVTFRTDAGDSHTVAHTTGGRTELLRRVMKKDLIRADVLSLGTDEGFHCTECGWRGVSAPTNDDRTGAPHGSGHSFVECRECGEGL